MTSVMVEKLAHRVPLRRLSREEKLDWLRLARCGGIGAIRFHKLVGRLGSAGAALRALPGMIAAGTATVIAFALLTRDEFSMGAADPLGKDAPGPLPERRHARRCAWRHRAGRAGLGERLRSLRRRRQCLGVDQRLVPPRLLRLCTEQYCSRYMVGTRGKGEPSTGTNHLGFRLVMDPVPAAAAR